MNTYVTGTIIKQLREARGLTQAELAGELGVTDKAISKWETGKGLPDISLISPLASALGVSIGELMLGRQTVNKNRSANMRRTKFYVCPVCGNIIHTVGECEVSCCGISLPVLIAEEPDDYHGISMINVEDEQFISIDHEMSREHHISFIAFLTDDRLEMKKLYPEGNAETRLSLRGMGTLYWYCSRHGLFSVPINGRTIKK